ncbi:hypothetical protein [Enterococcus sp. LJL51]|uniref:hypothetical protein n=1 Tax=Enterococcus sp. LJL51 TaxID=3416656 RepID=UPI003CEF2264
MDLKKGTDVFIWLGVTGVGAFLLIIGLIMLIVLAVRRKKILSGLIVLLIGLVSASAGGYQLFTVAKTLDVEGYMDLIDYKNVGKDIDELDAKQMNNEDIYNLVDDATAEFDKIEAELQGFIDKPETYNILAMGKTMTSAEKLRKQGLKLEEALENDTHTLSKEEIDVLKKKLEEKILVLSELVSQLPDEELNQ